MNNIVNADSEHTGTVRTVPLCAQMSRLTDSMTDDS